MTKIINFAKSAIRSLGLEFLRPYFSRVNFAFLSDAGYKLFLFSLGGATLFLIVLIKSKTAADFWSDPLLLFYTIFVTTFELSRLVGAMFYKYSASKIVSDSYGGGAL